MAEGRMLKRRITASKKVALLKTDKARLLWFYMLPFTDVDGRIEADCEDIRDEIIRKQRKGFTLDKIEECLQDLHQVGLIILYNANRKRYLEFTRFDEEQKNRNRDREAISQIPPPSQGEVGEHSETTPNKDKLSKDKLSKDKYGEFVYLAKEEYDKLVAKFGKTDADERIATLNNGIGSKGYKYKSHYSTILVWAKKDEKDAKRTGGTTKTRRDSYAKQESQYGQTIE